MKPQIHKIFVSLVFIILFCSISFAQSETAKGIEFFNNGDYKSAIEELKKVVKENPQNFEAFYYLGISSTRLEKYKDAKKYFEKSLSINPDYFDSNLGLAFILVLQNKPSESLPYVNKAILITPNNAESHTVLGFANLRLGNFANAIENANQAIKLNNKLASPYLLKAHSLIFDQSKESFAKVDGKYKYQRAVEYLNKYLELSPNLSKDDYWVKQKESLEYFADYYKQRELVKKDSENAQITPLKILSKPKPDYTDSARSKDISGIVRVLVKFSTDGKIEHILVVQSLDKGLDESAIKAARKIKFEPQKQNGMPISVVKILEYSFMIY